MWRAAIWTAIWTAMWRAVELSQDFFMRLHLVMRLHFCGRPFLLPMKGSWADASASVRLDMRWTGCAWTEMKLPAFPAGQSHLEKRGAQKVRSEAAVRKPRLSSLRSYSATSSLQESPKSSLTEVCMPRSTLQRRMVPIMTKSIITMTTTLRKTSRYFSLGMYW